MEVRAAIYNGDIYNGGTVKQKSPAKEVPCTFACVYQIKI